ncbi:MAG TPA: hypothetical protein VE826_10860 [Dongiaceae bacterium]|nr:hypothetical protein [Dongiaceae bacterium]
MTGGGDLDEAEHDDLDEALDVADEDDDVGVLLNEDDPDPTAGASDVGGLPGGIDDPDADGDDAHEPGGGQTGMGKGPTGS